MSGDLKERVSALLRSLGDHPDAVYGTLMGRGIQGRRDEGCDCPVANLIRQDVAEAADDEEWLHPQDIGRVLGWIVLRHTVWTPDGPVDTPDPVREFIRRFDEGDGVRDGEIFYPYEEDRDVDRAERFLDEFLGMHAANWNDRAKTAGEVIERLRLAARAAGAER